MIFAPNIWVNIALFGWVPVVFLLFVLLPARRAVIIAFNAAWLFLPDGQFARFHVPGIPALSKMSAACFGTLLAAAIFDSGRLWALRWRWFDLPMIVWCLCPFASSMTNGLGAYDGLSAATYQTIVWGLPYLVGRAYFSDLAGIRELAAGIVLGGLIYVPFCLFEMKMSPILHIWVYGYPQHDLGQTMRLGGWRPMVFMEHGLMVGMWMSMAALLAVWLWLSGAVRSVARVPISWLAPVLLVTAVLCRSSGAALLMLLGLLVLISVYCLRLRVLVLVLIVAAPLYAALRATGRWDGHQVLDMAAKFDPERADSLQTRLTNENVLAVKAMQQRVFGWGQWGRSRVDDKTIVDGLWIDAFGKFGLVGLASLFTGLLLAAAICTRRLRPEYWAHPATSAVAALIVVQALYSIDCVLNCMINPMFILTAGGLTGLVGLPTERPAATEYAPPVGTAGAVNVEVALAAPLNVYT